MSIHPSVGKVHRVRHTLTRRGRPSYDHHISDLIFVDGAPTIVIELKVRSDGDLPLVTVPLDPQKLHLLGGQAEYIYEDPIVDPRPFD